MRIKDKNSRVFPLENFYCRTEEDVVSRVSYLEELRLFKNKYTEAEVAYENYFGREDNLRMITNELFSTSNDWEITLDLLSESVYIVGEANNYKNFKAFTNLVKIATVKKVEQAKSKYYVHPFQVKEDWDTIFRYLRELNIKDDEIEHIKVIYEEIIKINYLTRNNTIEGSVYRHSPSKITIQWSEHLQHLKRVQVKLEYKKNINLGVDVLGDDMEWDEMI